MHLNFPLSKVKTFTPYKEGVEVKWQSEKETNTTYASIIAENKREINKQLSLLSNSILSERARTLDNLPKYRIMQTTKKRIY